MVSSRHDFDKFLRILKCATSSHQLLFAAGGEPSTRLPPEGLAEQLGQTVQQQRKATLKSDEYPKSGELSRRALNTLALTLNTPLYLLPGLKFGHLAKHIVKPNAKLIKLIKI